jgi:hypothetical protein
VRAEPFEVFELELGALWADWAVRGPPFPRESPLARPRATHRGGRSPIARIERASGKRRQEGIGARAAALVVVEEDVERDAAAPREGEEGVVPCAGAVRSTRFVLEACAPDPL